MEDIEILERGEKALSTLINECIDTVDYEYIQDVYILTKKLESILERDNKLPSQQKAIDELLKLKSFITENFFDSQSQECNLINEYVKKRIIMIKHNM